MEMESFWTEVYELQWKCISIQQRKLQNHEHQLLLQVQVDQKETEILQQTYEQQVQRDQQLAQQLAQLQLQHQQQHRQTLAQQQDGTSDVQEIVCEDYDSSDMELDVSVDIRVDPQEELERLDAPSLEWHEEESLELVTKQSAAMESTTDQQNNSKSNLNHPEQEEEPLKQADDLLQLLSQGMDSEEEDDKHNKQTKTPPPALDLSDLAPCAKPSELVESTTSTATTIGSSPPSPKAQKLTNAQAKQSLKKQQDQQEPPQAAIQTDPLESPDSKSSPPPPVVKTTSKRALRRRKSLPEIISPGPMTLKQRLKQRLSQESDEMSHLANMSLLNDSVDDTPKKANGLLERPKELEVDVVPVEKEGEEVPDRPVKDPTHELPEQISNTVVTTMAPVVIDEQSQKEQEKASSVDASSANASQPSKNTTKKSRSKAKSTSKTNSKAKQSKQTRDESESLISPPEEERGVNGGQNKSKKPSTTPMPPRPKSRSEDSSRPISQFDAIATPISKDKRKTMLKRRKSRVNETAGVKHGGVVHHENFRTNSDDEEYPIVSSIERMDQDKPTVAADQADINTRGAFSLNDTIQQDFERDERSNDVVHTITQEEEEEEEIRTERFLPNVRQVQEEHQDNDSSRRPSSPSPSDFSSVSETVTVTDGEHQHSDKPAQKQKKQPRKNRPSKKRTRFIAETNNQQDQEKPQKRVRASKPQQPTPVVAHSHDDDALTGNNESEHKEPEQEPQEEQARVPVIASMTAQEKNHVRVMSSLMKRATPTKKPAVPTTSLDKRGPTTAKPAQKLLAAVRKPSIAATKGNLQSKKFSLFDSFINKSNQNLPRLKPQLGGSL